LTARTEDHRLLDSPLARRQRDKPKLTEVWEKKRAQKIEQAPHGSLGNLTVRFKDYKLPPMDLLKWPSSSMRPRTKANCSPPRPPSSKRFPALASAVEPGDITRGPAITRYEVRPVDGLRVSRIANLDADLARATRAERINILAPIPGKDTVGIELANKEKIIVPLRELLEDDAFINGKAKLPVALGKDVYGKTIIGDLAAMPHLLVAGATGSGKSVCINSIVTSLICRFAPDELRFIMIDPKVVEMQNYEELPHLALPVVTDPKKALLALRWVVKEMENRYQIFAQEGCRNFETFNNRNRKRKADQDAKRALPAAARRSTCHHAANARQTYQSRAKGRRARFDARCRCRTDDPRTCLSPCGVPKTMPRNSISTPSWKTSTTR
jgi:S-DNA-T family DNA segregation ATPase FtsK/SpoIIIE